MKPVNTQINLKRMSNIYITKKDKFVWLDVTKRCKSSMTTLELNQAHELYAVNPDDVDYLIEDTDIIPTLIKQGCRICIEVGHLPKEYKPTDSWKDTDKELINGYWYVKMADIN